MAILRCSLIADGPSDNTLLPILEWLFNQYDVFAKIQKNRVSEHNSLEQRIEEVLDAGEIDLLFIHRDAERETREKRRQEISEAVDLVENCPPFIPVIPTRMTEAWLLFDENAIKRAAGNAGYKLALDMPPLKRIELLPNPKGKLFELLKAAHNPKTKRKRKGAGKEKYAERYEVANQIDDFSPLRQLSAFQAFEADFCRVLGLELQEP